MLVPITVRSLVLTLAVAGCSVPRLAPGDARPPISTTTSGLPARSAAAGGLLQSEDYETKRSEVLGRVSQAFIEMLEAQDRTTLTRDIVGLAEQVAGAVAERVSAGKVPPIEDTRARGALASTRLELDRARRALEAARHRLAATWGSAQPRFDAEHERTERVRQAA